MKVEACYVEFNISLLACHANFIISLV